METVVLHRVGLLECFCPKQDQDFKPSAAPLYPNISLRSKRSCVFLAKGNEESAKNEARRRGRGEKGTLVSNHCESQIRPLGVACFSDFDKMTTVENTQSKFGGRNTGGSKQTIVPCESSVKTLHVSSKVFTDLQIALKIHGAAICKM